MPQKASPPSKPRFSHPLLLVVVSVMLTAFVSYIFLMRSQSATNKAKVQELYGLVDRMRDDLIGNDYKSFRKNAIEFRMAASDHRYSEALHLDALGQKDSLDSMLNAENSNLLWYLGTCGTEPPLQPEDSGSCSAKAKPYISNSLDVMATTLQKRLLDWDRLIT
jgi:hypothetical protein